jgi:hypothetical protein
MYLVMAYGLGGFTALCAAIAGVGAQGRRFAALQIPAGAPLPIPSRKLMQFACRHRGDQPPTRASDRLPDGVIVADGCRPRRVSARVSASRRARR